MRIYPEGVAVTLTIPFVDHNGDPVSPVEAVVRVVDEAGVELIPASSVCFAEGDLEVEVAVAAEANRLQAGSSQAMRVVELTMITDAGPVVARERYVIRSTDRLQVMVNSFQTYDHALLVSLDMPRMDGWNGADEMERIAALVTSFERLTRLGYRIPEPARDIQAVLEPRYARYISPNMWRAMSVEQFNEILPDHFKRSLCKAQIAEADVVLNGDVIAGRRRAGLLSETIGESSMMFRSGKPLDLGVSEEALSYLTGYVDLKARVGRT